MKLAYLELNRFRGYRQPLRIDFGEHFTIIDGRNGVGKSTIFDAIEYALTGRIGKYDIEKAGGETVNDYIWWRGGGPISIDGYVKVGFRDNNDEICIIRKELEESNPEQLKLLNEKLCDQLSAPSDPLVQLCTNAIIRDEHITKLSLDLKETDRYSLLRDALGANDSDLWTNRASNLMSQAKSRRAEAEKEVNSANATVADAARRLDEARASIVEDEIISQAVVRLQNFANTLAPPDQLAGHVRKRMAVLSSQVESINTLTDNWYEVEKERLRIPDLTKSVEVANAEEKAAKDALQSIPLAPESPASALAEDARNLVTLITIGRQLGLQNGHCPLCASGQSHDEFEHGIEQAETIARRLNENAALAAEQEQARTAAEARLTAVTRTLKAAESDLKNAQKIITDFEKQARAQGISTDETLPQTIGYVEELHQMLESAQNDLHILETIKLSTELERAQRAEADAKNRLARAQERLGRALKAESGARALHGAARRAVSETLDRRLERVLPLMSELYRRLRPHPVWNDIEYSIRGDVRRFLSLQVGEELNPQFLFSSGQRRATGLAFLLSVNLSLAWSRWRTIMLDDPVQHVDDFRTVHLAELAAQLVTEGRQIICAVEDPALADLLCRRLPIGQTQGAKRITLGTNEDGDLIKKAERTLTPLPMNALAPTTDNQPQTG